MKIFLTSDVHLGMKFAGYPGIQERLVEARFDALRRCVDIANEEGCELFVVGGDLFDRVSVTKGDIQRAAEILAEFQGRLVAILPGNHDYITQRPDGLWAVFKGYAGNHLLVLEEKKIYPLGPFDLDVNLYAAPCDAKHSADNHVGWIKNAEKAGDAAFHIGVAHGSLEGLSPDFNRDYYPMTETELLGCGLDLWLMGHTHIPYPSRPGPRSRIFYPGTPEPDGFDCNHGGSALLLEIDEEKGIKPAFVNTGTHRFVQEEDRVGSRADLESIRDRYADPGRRNTLLKLKLKGALLEEDYKELEAIRLELEKHLCFLHFDSSEVGIKITPGLIEKEFTEHSFPYRLLKNLVEENDFEALQIAYELIRETRR